MGGSPLTKGKDVAVGMLRPQPVKTDVPLPGAGTDHIQGMGHHLLLKVAPVNVTQRLLYPLPKGLGSSSRERQGDG
jgi:hypothetical protein